MVSLFIYVSALLFWCWVIFFFFKQKTAYEMRISDWSSDVCSSDLGGSAAAGRRGPSPPGAWRARRSGRVRSAAAARPGHRPTAGRRRPPAAAGSPRGWRWGSRSARPRARRRSEEHTSELQSLIRISYAVFFLKKKNTTNIQKQVKINTQQY